MKHQDFLSRAGKALSVCIYRHTHKYLETSPLIVECSVIFSFLSLAQAHLNTRAHTHTCSQGFLTPDYKAVQLLIITQFTGYTHAHCGSYWCFTEAAHNRFLIPFSQFWPSDAVLENPDTLVRGKVGRGRCGNVEKKRARDSKAPSSSFAQRPLSLLAVLETSVSTQAPAVVEERAEGPGMRQARPRNQWSRSAWHGCLVYLP